jgi:TPP-dependent pyruvate/acetoin dehydrogenase alpha subunit
MRGYCVTAEELVAFEADVAAAFNRGEIRAPIHLDGGNERQLIDIFKEIKPTDWVFCSWRSHYKAILHGVPPAKVKAEIMAGRSIALCFPEHRFFSSAIVGGTLPIALGVALAIKRRGGSEKAWCLIGDMTRRTGVCAECLRYAMGHNLPLYVVTEDNGISVCTSTLEAWGRAPAWDWSAGGMRHFDYKLPHHHSGAGVRVQF